MTSESYKRVKQIANDKIDKRTMSAIQEEYSYGNPILYIFVFIIFLLVLINLF